jgi:hypothetical protein
VEFGQGIAQTTNCTVGDFLTVTPNSGYSNGGSSGSFDLTSFTLSHIPSTCWNKNFLFQAYDSGGNLLAIDNAATSLSATYQGASTSGSGDITGALGEQTSDATSDGYYGAFTITIANPVATTTSVNRVVVQSSVPSSSGHVVSGLVAYWNFNDHSYPFRDLVSEIDLSEVGSVNYVSKGRFGGEISLSGYEALIGSIPALPKQNSQYSIVAWIQPSTPNSGGIAGWGDYGTVNGTNAFRLNGYGLDNYWWGNDLNTSSILQYSSPQWYFVCATFDGTTRRIFLDSSEVASDSQGNGHNVVRTDDFGIGITNGGEYFKGKIDDVGIFNKALSPVEITNLYTSNMADVMIR